MVYVQHVFKAHPEQVFLRYFWLFLWLHFGMEICKVIRLILPKTCKFNTHNQAIFLYKSMLYVLFRVDEILATKLTAGNVDDRKPVPEMAKDLYGKLYGDKGYVSSLLSDELFEQDVGLITHVRRNMKPRAIALWDKIMLKKRFITETVTEQLKNITQIEHSRHRSVSGFMLKLIGSLIAYCHKKDKPTIRIDESDMKTLCI